MKDVINTIRLSKKIRNNFGWDYVVAYLFDKYVVPFWTAVAMIWGIVQKDIAFLDLRVKPMHRPCHQIGAGQYMYWETFFRSQ